ncbi:MAG TPA: hypothetical protein VK152_08410 [Paludibacter sp.]|nr:hypothetical protein [Paludibacter sp.]
MRRCYKVSMLCFMLNSILNTEAQSVVVDGEIRPRTEFQDGYKSPILSATDPGIFTSERTRLGFTFSSGLLTTQITVQDSRVFGQFATSSSDATTGIYEAWAEMLLFPGGSLKIGRQPVKYDDSRLFSAPAWSITGTTHDLMVLKYNINDFQAHLGLGYNNNKEIATETFYAPGSKYRSIGYLWASAPTRNGFTLTAMAVAEGWQDTLGLGGVGNYKKTDLVQALTCGGNLKYETAGFPLSGLATAYFQSGKNVAGKKLNGKLLALKINYVFTKAVSASTGTDYLSGDKNGAADGIQGNFKKLYGADHTFNGYMDYWNTPLTQGLLDYYGSITGKIAKKLTLEGGYHVFNTEFAGKNKKGVAFAKDLGSEFDFLATYKLNSWTTVQGGYCRYFSNNNTLIAKDLVTNASAIPAARTPQWAYIMFTIKPTFLKQPPN